ncbi:hypothetical protein ACHAQD_002550 [Fusarium lateritium]
MVHRARGFASNPYPRVNHFVNQDILGDSEETGLQYAQLIKARCFRSNTQPAARFWAFSMDSLQNVTKDTEASKEVIVFDASIEDTLKQDLELK